MYTQKRHIDGLGLAKYTRYSIDNSDEGAYSSCMVTVFSNTQMKAPAVSAWNHFK
jgi:hypothetical protein